MPTTSTTDRFTRYAFAFAHVHFLLCVFDTLDFRHEEISNYPVYMSVLWSPMSVFNCIGCGREKTSGQSHLTKGRIAAARGWFNPFASPCLISWRSVTALPRYRNFSVFNMGPSTILDLLCARLIANTEHLVVFIILQNLDGIDAVVSTIRF